MWLALILWASVAYLCFRWRDFPDPFRTGLILTVLVLALGSGVSALFLGGTYETEVVLFIGGPYAYQVETIERSIPGLALGIGAALLLLAVLMRWGARLPWKSPVGTAFKLTMAVIVFRVFAEKLGAPPHLAMLIGVIWLAPPVGVYFGVIAGRDGSLKQFGKNLLAYTYSVRGVILVIMLVATGFELGTHFDNSGVTEFSVLGRDYEMARHSWDKYASLLLFPQLVLWPAVTLLLGGCFGLGGYVVGRQM